MLDIIGTLKDKVVRRKERRSALNYNYLFSDSIHFVNANQWDAVATHNTIFMSRAYLEALEKYPPDNTVQRYAIAYSEGVPVLILACQLAEIGGERLTTPDDHGAALISKYNERVLVCGNLVSSGLHGVAFAKDLDIKTGWRIVAEMLYKIRRGEKLSGQIDFAVIKDIKGDQLETSKVLERYSYRKIQTDPDMVLDFGTQLKSFDDYLNLLISKYRSRVKKIIKSIDDAGFICKPIDVDEATDQKLHALYLQVEEQSKTRLATLPLGYFYGLAQNLGQNFACYGITKGEEIFGFISVIKDGDDAIAYYVGFDYPTNSEHPLYFRLLQLVIEAAIIMRCKKVVFGRTALEPKACLGAKPVETYVLARHRIPVVNFFVRNLFRNVPFDEAPERNVIKE
jgi:Acetyltransferase (GNAT) domain